MNHTSPFVVARVAHERLRRRVVHSTPDEKSTRDYGIIKTTLDGLWRVAARFPDTAHTRQIIDGVRADAEYVAGLTDAEGFHTADEVSLQYLHLEQAFTPNGDT
jgi:hypothetical protein